MTPDKLETQLRGVGVSGPELSSPSSLPVLCALQCTGLYSADDGYHVSGLRSQLEILP